VEGGRLTKTRAGRQPLPFRQALSAALHPKLANISKVLQPATRGTDDIIHLEGQKQFL
jgi:hypothetical protein